MTPPAPIRVRDVIAIGCSAGGVEALPRILQQLPPDLPAAGLIVQHLAPTSSALLAGILDRSARVAVAWAEQGAAIVPGQVLVAPPDAHLLVADGHVHLSGGARENHSRPSIDKLFRSVAAAYGSRAIGVLLTGMLDDGVAGLLAIRAAGGIVVVQDPADAAFPELPGRALQVLEPDHVLPIDAIGALLVKLVGGMVPVVATPSEIALEAEIDLRGAVPPEQMHALGAQAAIACPECHGPMWTVGNEQARRFRCYLGHAHSARDLLDANAKEVESALWSAVRSLNDRAMTLETLGQDARRMGYTQAAENYDRPAKEARRQAELARKFLLDLGRLP
jgi:two-component system chemotaxis response regulator CheB